MAKSIRSVLIVDDNPADIEWCRIMMEQSGRYAHFLTAKDGREAIAMFTDHEASRAQHGELFPPLLILLDINMPRMDGFEFLEEYAALRKSHESTADTPVVMMLTSSAEFKDQHFAKQFPVVKDYLVKPLTEERATEIADVYGE